MIILSFFRYIVNDEDKVGVYIAADPLTQDRNYYEVEILDSGLQGTIGEELSLFLYFSFSFFKKIICLSGFISLSLSLKLVSLNILSLYHSLKVVWTPFCCQKYR